MCEIPANGGVFLIGSRVFGTLWGLLIALETAASATRHGREEGRRMPYTLLVSTKKVLWLAAAAKGLLPLAVKRREATWLSALTMDAQGV